MVKYLRVQGLPHFTLRTNPWDFPGLTGPGVLNVDGALVKEVKITEKLKSKFQVDAFNLLNNLRWADPVTSVSDANFGQSTKQANLLFGRRMQLGARFEF